METLPTNNYGVIYADPPWNFRTHSKSGSRRSAAVHYGCMCIDVRCDLPISIVARDAVVLLL